MATKDPFLIIRTILGIISIVAFIRPAWPQVSGVVTDHITGIPISDALVTLQTTSTRAKTSQDGRFNLSDATGTDMVIVGAKQGYYNHSIVVTAPADTVVILLQPVPQDNNTDYEPINPNVCRKCHPSQYLQWAGSPMAKAGINTWLYDIYSGDGTVGGIGGFVYKRDSEYAASNPASECGACHQPEPWMANPFTPIDPVNQISTGATHGISCEVCHKMARIDVDKPNYPGIYPGVVTMTRPDSGSHQVEYGVLGDSDFDLSPSVMRSSYQPQLTAEVCAACHQDKNDPDEDGDFEAANGIISEPTYLEWLASPYGDPTSPLYATCVDCHMPSYGVTTVCQGDYDPPIRNPETIRSHRIEGTTPTFLENAVTMTVRGRVVGNTIETKIFILNDKTGHHVPDGVTIRNMILLVEAWRSRDGLPLTNIGTQVVDELGGVGNPDQGYYAGLPGKLFAKVNHDSRGHGPTFFTDATGIQWDNRIPALATDSTFYVFEIPNNTDTYHIRARLIYRRAFRFLVDAKSWTEDGHGTPLEDVQAPYFGHLMEEEEWISKPEVIEIPELFQVYQNYPNPFNSVTTIRYDLSEDAQTVLIIYNSLGQEVRTLVNEYQVAGHKSVSWNGRNNSGKEVSSGTYIYRVQTRDKIQRMKMSRVR